MHVLRLHALKLVTKQGSVGCLALDSLQPDGRSIKDHLLNKHPPGNPQCLRLSAGHHLLLSPTQLYLSRQMALWYGPQFGVCQDLLDHQVWMQMGGSECAPPSTEHRVTCAKPLPHCPEIMLDLHGPMESLPWLQVASLPWTNVLGFNQLVWERY